MGARDVTPRSTRAGAQYREHWRLAKSGADWNPSARRALSPPGVAPRAHTSGRGVAMIDIARTAHVSTRRAEQLRAERPDFLNGTRSRETGARSQGIGSVPLQERGDVRPGFTIDNSDAETGLRARAFRSSRVFPAPFTIGIGHRVRRVFW
jgi:hypothetical protein